MFFCSRVEWFGRVRISDLTSKGNAADLPLPALARRFEQSVIEPTTGSAKGKS